MSLPSKTTFTYAGAEQQPKPFKDPPILSLNVELELKAEKDNAKVGIDQVSVGLQDYRATRSRVFLLCICDQSGVFG